MEWASWFGKYYTIGEGLLAKASPSHESGSTRLQARVSFKDFVM
jgi:hypothetical protein